ncbi:MAG: hypothetical protein AAF657_18345, partial [Acidobacteriota bacterium]
DVPAFSSHVGLADGSIGGVGWRPDALRLVLLATDICSVAPFDAGSGIPATIDGAGGVSEPVSAFACTSTTPGIERFGFVADAKSAAENTVADAVAPLDASSVGQAVAALNTMGVRVIGLAPGGAPTASTEPDLFPSTFLSALARLTGAVSEAGSPLVFDIGSGAAEIGDAIVEAVSTAAAIPIDIALETTDLGALDLVVAADPPVREDVGVGETATFEVTFTGGPTFFGGVFDLEFVDTMGSTVLGTIPVTLVCPVDPILPLADVAADPTGDFLVAWEGLDGFDRGVFAQAYDAGGSASGGVFRVNPAGPGDQSYPAAAYLGGGRYVVVYLDGVESPNSVVGQIVDRNGPLGGPFVVDATEPTCDIVGSGECVLRHPAVAAAPDGWFVVAWDEGDGLPDFRTSYGRLFDADGLAVADPFLIHSILSGDISITPALAMFDDGSFVAAVEQIEGVASDLIQQIAFDSAANRLGDQQVNLFRPGKQSAPTVATLVSGEPLVLWQSEGLGGPNGSGIFGRIDPSDPMAPEFQVNSIVAGDQVLPDVAGDSIGGFSAVWLDRPRNAVVGQRFDPRGDLVDGEVRISEESLAELSRPRLAALPGQRLVTVWGAAGSFTDPAGEIFVELLEPPAAAQCVSDPTILCLNESRFRLEARWTTPSGASGEARAEKLNTDSGYFWFFDPDNVELAVKVLDACGAPEPCYWVFAGGMTNVEVELVVIDTLTGQRETYRNPQGQNFRPIFDTTTFVKSASVQSPVRGRERAESTVLYRPESGFKATSESSCDGLDDSLCLESGRFRVDLEWVTPAGELGRGQPVALTENAGYFWFFSPNNLEAVVKVLDGCAINGHYWVFGTGLTDVGVELTVTDTLNGEIATYGNPLGRPFEPILDVRALATCP